MHLFKIQIVLMLSREFNTLFLFIIKTYCEAPPALSTLFGKIGIYKLRHNVFFFGLA